MADMTMADMMRELSKRMQEAERSGQIKRGPQRKLSAPAQVENARYQRQAFSIYKYITRLHSELEQLEQAHHAAYLEWTERMRDLMPDLPCGGFFIDPDGEHFYELLHPHGNSEDADDMRVAAEAQHQVDDEQSAPAQPDWARELQQRIERGEA
jgi:hypothetical protein